MPYGYPITPTPPTPIDYSKEYLTLEILSDGVINWYSQSYDEGFAKHIWYSINGGEWNEITPVEEFDEKNELYISNTPIEVHRGDKIRFKGNNPYYGQNDGDNHNSFENSTSSFNVYGNIMSLIGGDDFSELKEFSTGDNQFVYLFSHTSLVDASNLILPVEVLTYGCYQNIFSDCTSLVNAPELPATTLVGGCYNMFYGCTSLVNTPELPATTLADYCYSGMFSYCTSLNNIKCLAEDISAEDCLNTWLFKVSQSGTFTKKSGVEYPSGTSGIPTGWTVIEV